MPAGIYNLKDKDTTSDDKNKLREYKQNILSPKTNNLLYFTLQ